jgi:hypothetical protein
MAYHESFWLAVSAASPIIGLANTVAITDLAGIWLQARAYRRSGPSRYYYVYAIVLAVANYFGQGLALYIALSSLLKGQDEPKGAGDTVLTFLMIGLADLLLIVLHNISLRYRLRRDEKQEDEEAEKGKHARPDQ